MSLFPVWSRLSLRVKSLLVLSVPLVPLLLAAAAVIVTSRQQIAAQAVVAHTLDVKSQISDVLFATIDAEAALKDYWLSRDSAVHDRFEALIQAWPDLMDRLLALVSDNAVQAAHIVRARELSADRPLMSLRDYLHERPAEPRPPQAMLDQSRRLIAGIRAELEEMQRVEDRLLTERVTAVRIAEARVQRVAVFGALFGLVGGVVCAVSFSREVSRRISEVGENAERLVRQEPLRYVRPSQDEVGQLGAQVEQIWGLTAERIEALDRARNELDHFFSVALDLLCIIGLDGRFRRVNPAFTATLGWEQEEMIGASYLDLLHPDDLDTVNEARRQIAASGVIQVDARYRCKDGSYRWLSWKSTPPSADGVFAAARDITDQRRIHTELNGHLADLRELNDELESFTYTVSHDLRAPLRHVAGFNGFIVRSAAARLTEQEHRWLQLSIEATQRMGRMIDDLLAFSRMGRTALNTREVSLNDVVREARHEAEHGMDEGRRVAWSIAPLPDVHGDAKLLHNVFANLLNNALKYTRREACATITVGTLPDRDAQAVVFVRDNGVGFDAQYAHKLFGVFQRLHSQEEFEGTGIGLATVRRIVQRHGGEVWGEGTPGGGATFYVSLPLVQKEKIA